MLILLLVGCGLWAVICLAIALVAFGLGDQNTAVSSDVIIVLGAGLRRDGGAGDALWRRSRVAAQAYEAGLAPHVVCTGGVSPQQTRSEAEACREILLRQGVPYDAIVLEDASHSTEENAINTKAIMDERGWQTAIVVSDSYHMLRAGWIFSDIGIDHTRYPVPRNWIRIFWYASSLAREVAAVHWYAIKGVLGIPATSFPF